MKRIYFSWTRGHNRPIAASEALGRLISCGFEIVEYKEIEGLLYFAGRKVREAEYVPEPTYGPLCTLRRIGRGGDIIVVSKLRTMHPYAEFLQEYLYQCNNLQEGGKLRDDFRVTSWGRWLRRLWLDELPMIWNLLKGEVKIVGVRPLSPHYFSLYPKRLQELRKRNTPGLLPPFYVDMPRTFDEIVDSEQRYLEAFERAPFRTDLYYLIVAIWNIVIKRARSS